MQIFIAKGSEQSGPFTLQQIHEQLNQGELTLDDHYFHEGLGDWSKLTDLDFNSLELTAKYIPPINKSADAQEAESGTSGIPDILERDIENFVEELDHSLGSNMLSVVMYGGMVKGKTIKITHPVNLMVVVREITTKILDQIAEPYMMSLRKDQLQLLILSKEDLLSSTDVFPIKFLDMQQDYRVLRGEDLVKNLEVNRDHLRLRCEQEIKNLMLRLRQAYLMNSTRPKALSGVMIRSYSAFLSAADVLAELSTGNVYRSEDEILDASENIGLNTIPLRRIQELREGQIFDDPVDQKRVYEHLMATVRHAAKMADQLEHQHV